MVRLQLGYYRLILDGKYVGSQFHYGSITTRGRRGCYTKDYQKVSIPLWFDYNITVKLLKSNIGPNGLNSTMVRLQLVKEYLLAFLNFQSQFHYGSITTVVTTAST